MAGRDSKVEKWLHWIEEPITNEVIAMNQHRDAYQTIMRLAQEAKLPNSYLWAYLRETYTTTQAVAVRRQAEASEGVQTIGRLIAEAHNDEHRLTRDWWVGLWDAADDSIDQRMAQHEFATTFGGEVGDHFDPAIARADLDLLKQHADAVREFVNHHVAHSKATRTRKDLTFEQLDAAIDTIGDLFAKYTALLTARG